jgi:phosphate transport system protein
MTEGHTVRSYDAELEQLRTVILEMGGLVGDQVMLAVRALAERDEQAVDTVLKREERVNAYDTEAEDLVLNLLAKRQPMGSDLRVITSLGRGVMDLERAGDEAKKIAKIARRLAADHLPVDGDLLRSAGSMAALAARLLKDVIEALDDADAERAVRVAKADAELDAEYKTALQLIHRRLVEDPAIMQHAADLVVVIKALERIGDHAKNIARYVIFIVKGKDVRHVKTVALEKEL